ncbi:hypothetical protein KY347_03520, partial [Candidatus Woesearchaeota archaeon]|nr:hypothetical protein [Candidatus Woesearchaeota archaeon]
MIKGKVCNNAISKKANMIVLFLVILFITLSISVFAIPDSLTLQGKLTDLSGASQAGTFNFTFRIYDAFTGGNVLWQDDDRNITTDANGIYDVILHNLSALNFSDQYYLGITVGSDNESEPRVNLTSTPYAFRANISEDLNKENKYTVSVLNVTGNLSIGDNFDDVLTVTTGRLNITDGEIKTVGNLTLGEKIVFGLGQVIDNLISGTLRISGILNVTGNTTIAETLFVDNTSGRVGIGTTTPAYSLDVAGTLRGQNFITSANYSVNDILIPQEVWNYGPVSLTGSIGMDILDWEEKVSATVFESATTIFVSATALTNGNVLIAYEDGGNSNYGTLVIYDSAGNQIKAPTVFESGRAESISATALTNGNVLIAYRDHDNSDYGTFVIYDSAGNQIKAPTVFESGGIYYISATALTNGNVLIAYDDGGNSNYGTLVIYDSAGNQIIAPTVFESGRAESIS